VTHAGNSLYLMEAGMWSTLFAIAVGASVWFSAVSLSVEFNKQRAIFIAAIYKQHDEAGYRQAASNRVSEEQPPGSLFN
jgi:hypothetical protein